MTSQGRTAKAFNVMDMKQSVRQELAALIKSDKADLAQLAESAALHTRTYGDGKDERALELIYFMGVDLNRCFPAHKAAQKAELLRLFNDHSQVQTPAVIAFTGGLEGKSYEDAVLSSLFL